MPGHASLLLILGLAALPACNHDGAEDAAIAPGSASAAIPMGAVGAVGVAFDLPSAAAGAAPAPRPLRPRSGARPLPPIPLDPFADPPEPDADAGAPRAPHPPRGTAL